MSNYFLKILSLLCVLLILTTLSAQSSMDDVQYPSAIEQTAKKQGWALTRKAPYLIYEGNSQEMTLLWQLTSSATCSLEWGNDTSYALGSVETNEYGDDHQHRYTFSGLESSMKYYYRVTAGSDIHTGSFRAAAADTTKNLKFIVYGDTRSYPQKHNLVAGKILETIQQDEAYQTITFSVGDLVHYGDEESDWSTQFFNPDYPDIIRMLASFPYQACRGNHEQSAVLFKKYFPYPFVDGRYWSFDYGPVHFVVVDQYTDYSQGSTQLNWIENDLASTKKLWKFFLLHEPGWSAGGHENEQGVQKYLQPLCRQYNVPLVFGGHNHYYARAVVNDIHHITTGGGGAPIYSADPNYPYVVKTAQVHHFCTIDIQNDLLYFTATDINGNQIDYFVTNKYGILPYDVTVSSLFIPKGQDSLLIRAPVKNPYQHNIEVNALLLGKSGIFTDTLVLFDDGSHGDGAPNDGVWGNFSEAISIEDEFAVDIAITDIDSNMYFQSPRETRFTTIGPVVFDHYRITSRDTIPHHNDKLKFEFYLSNLGESKAAANVTSRIVPLDSFAFISAIITSEYGNIEAGNTVASQNKQYIKFDLGSEDSVNVRFAIDVFSNGYFFWSDTFTVFVQKETTRLSRMPQHVPGSFELFQNYPNPFNPITHIGFSIPQADWVVLSIINILGEQVATLVNKKLTSGRYEYIWDASSFPSGVYYYQLKTGSGLTETKKLTVLK